MSNQQQQKGFFATIRSNPTAIFWIAAGFLGLGLLVALVIVPEWLWLSIFLGVLLVVDFGLLIRENKKALKSRSAAFGLNSVITTLLVLGIVGVLNFLVNRHQLKWDLTKEKIHTLSDQTDKVTKGLKSEVKAVFFGKVNQREEVRPLLENYKNLTKSFSLEYVDPDKEPLRDKQVGVKKYNTLLLSQGPRDVRVEEPTEEKVTNALIKLTREKPPFLCPITGHGEKDFDSQEAEGLSTIKKGLTDQSVEFKIVNLMQEAAIPEVCDAIAIMGPNRAFFEKEVKVILDYLADGGRAIIATDFNVKGVGAEGSPELLSILAKWYIQPLPGLVVDPLSRMLGADAAVPILATFNKGHAISKDFQGNCFSPFTRPLEALTGAPAGLKIDWIAQTTPNSWGEMDVKEFARGQVSKTDGKDKAGPLTAAFAVSWKLDASKAKRDTRLVVFGSALFASNNYSRFGGNQDFFLNSVSWALEDESMISIRAKEGSAGKVELTKKSGEFIFLLTVVILPLLIAAGGVAIWAYRRRL